MGKQHKPNIPGAGSSGMMAQLARLQEQMQRAQQELEEETVTATSGGGAITIVMTGGQLVRSVRIAPEVLQQADAELLGDMLAAAFNQAVKASKDLAQQKLGPLMP
jgi:DNA-binding YbaB/EbfC family protein